MKKFIAMALALVLTATVAVSGTVAYLTSTDNAVNVMTTGNVKIEQNEYERNENGVFVAFQQNKPVLPAIFSNGTKTNPTSGEQVTFVDSKQYLTWSVNDKNIIDKFVNVKNTGKNDVYFRTILAVEVGDIPLYKSNGSQTYKFRFLSGYDSTADLSSEKNMYVLTRLMGEDGKFATVELNGQTYMIMTYTYKAKLAAGAESAPSLQQTCLGHNVTSEEIATLGDTWEILALSQAVQADEWVAETDENGNVTKRAENVALDEAFGEVTAENVAKWFKNIAPSNVTN